MKKCNQLNQCFQNRKKIKKLKVALVGKRKILSKDRDVTVD